MPLRFHSTALATVLLLSTLGCAKKEEPTPAPAPAPASRTGSYKLDGRLVNCKATAVMRATSTNQNWLTVRLTTTPQPASGEEYVEVSFTKSPGRPTSDYIPQDAVLIYPNNQTNSLGFYLYNSSLTGPTPNTLTITDSGKGGFSGTFSLNSYQLNHTLKEGVFTDVAL